MIRSQSLFSLHKNKENKLIIHKQLYIRPSTPTPKNIRNKLQLLRYGKLGNKSRKIKKPVVSTLPAITRISKNNSLNNISSSININKMANKWRRKVKSTNFAQALHTIDHEMHTAYLTRAIKNGRVHEFKAIIRHCVQNCEWFDVKHEVNSTCNHDIPHIINAITNCRYNILRNLLFLGANVHVCGPAPNFFPAIIYALISGSLEIIELLMENGGILTCNDIKLVKKKSRAFLHHRIPNEMEIRRYLQKHWSHKLLSATLDNNENAVLLILVINRGSHAICYARDTRIGRERDSAIHISCKSDNDKIVGMILKHSPKCSTMRNHSNIKLLYIFICMYNILLCTNICMHRPLQIALAHDSLRTVKLLLDMGEKINFDEFLKVLQMHTATANNCKLKYMELYAHFALQSVLEDDKTKVVSELMKHFKVLNPHSGSSLQHIAQLMILKKMDEHQDISTDDEYNLENEQMEEQSVSDDDADGDADDDMAMIAGNRLTLFSTASSIFVTKKFKSKSQKSVSLEKLLIQQTVGEQKKNNFYRSNGSMSYHSNEKLLQFEKYKLNTHTLRRSKSRSSGLRNTNIPKEDKMIQVGKHRSMISYGNKTLLTMSKSNISTSNKKERILKFTRKMSNCRLNFAQDLDSIINAKMSEKRSRHSTNRAALMWKESLKKTERTLFENQPDL